MTKIFLSKIIFVVLLCFGAASGSAQVLLRTPHSEIISGRFEDIGCQILNLSESHTRQTPIHCAIAPALALFFTHT